MVGILFCRQDSAHRVGKDRSHPLLDVFVLAPLGMPPVGDAFDGLRVLGVEQALLGPGGRVRSVFREADVPVELHERQAPPCGEAPYGGVVGRPRVVPVGAEDDDGGFTRFRAVVLRFRVVLQGVTLALVAFDDVIERRGVVASVERRRVIGVLLFQAARGRDVAVVDLHDDQRIHLVQLPGVPERALGHPVGRVGDRLAADGPVERPGVQLPASDFEPAVLRRGERGPGEEDRIFRVLLRCGVSPCEGQRKQQCQ